MKVVLDENVSSGLSGALASVGFDVFRVGMDLPSGSTDDEVFTLVRKERAILITRDHHFTNPIRFNAAKTNGIVYIHHGNLSSDQEIGIVADFLTQNSPDTFAGRLVTLYRKTVRIR
jgi:predicted nuclease of predicted toxin-antitoxin system